MPAVSKAQQTAAAIAEHAPASELKGASKEMAKSMSKNQLRHFSKTKREDLPEHVEKQEAAQPKFTNSFIMGYHIGYTNAER